MPSDMDSWARRINVKEEVPAEFKEVFASFTTGLSGFPYIVFAPPDSWGRKRTNAKLIAIYDGKVLYAEKIKHEITSREFLFENILYVECGMVLLHSWLKIAVKSEEKSFTVVIDFNSVVKSLFDKIFMMIRVITNRIYLLDRNDESYLAEKRRFDYLAKTNYKYMNFSKESLIPGEKILSIVYQPLVETRSCHIFKHIGVFPKILILTDKELIIIQDEKIQTSGRYGGIWTYAPLAKILDITFNTDLKTNYLNLIISFSEQEIINLKFSKAKVELEKFVANFKKARHLHDKVLENEISGSK